jgi:hypothetical protein
MPGLLWQPGGLGGVTGEKKGESACGRCLVGWVGSLAEGRVADG